MTATVVVNWVVAELSGANLGDAWLNRRLIRSIAGPRDGHVLGGGAGAVLELEDAAGAPLSDRVDRSLGL